LTTAYLSILGVAQVLGKKLEILGENPPMLPQKPLIGAFIDIDS
jgi:hypothetical protein